MLKDQIFIWLKRIFRQLASPRRINEDHMSSKVANPKSSPSSSSPPTTTPNPEPLPSSSSPVSPSTALYLRSQWHNSKCWSTSSYPSFTSAASMGLSSKSLRFVSETQNPNQKLPNFQTLTLKIRCLSPPKPSKDSF